jgi:hypothetical protein
MWRRRIKRATRSALVAEDFGEWVEHLPFVVERPHGLADGVHTYLVDCVALGQRATWLMVDCEAPGSLRPTSIAAILPGRAARRAERLGWGRCFTPPLPTEMARDHDMVDRVVFKLDPLARREDVEAVVLAAYSAAIDWSLDGSHVVAPPDRSES